ncbi:hypothetical protein TURU_119538 [Turdus rufiventris]|nr:hypothetical protein TURU_119538 [Turdus rufiventris]
MDHFLAEYGSWVNIGGTLKKISLGLVQTHWKLQQPPAKSRSSSSTPGASGIDCSAVAVLKGNVSSG